MYRCGLGSGWLGQSPVGYSASGLRVNLCHALLKEGTCTYWFTLKVWLAHGGEFADNLCLVLVKPYLK